MAALLALLSATAYGMSDFFGGLSARRLPSAAVVLRTHAWGLVALGLLLPVAGGTLTGDDLVTGALGGIAGAFGVMLFYQALAAGTMSVVAPITAVTATIVPVAFGIFDGERPSTLGLVGIPVSLIAITLLAREPGEAARVPGEATREPGEATPGPGEVSGEAARGPGGETREPGGRTAVDQLTVRQLLASLGGGLGFGAFFIALDMTGDDAGLWPVVAGRVTSVTLFALITLAIPATRVGDARARQGSVPAMLIVAGLLDAWANALFLVATRHGMLSTVAVLSALYPAATVLLARGFLDERLARPQLAGVTLAGLAVALVTLA